jgi:hypothetical protein
VIKLVTSYFCPRNQDSVVPNSTPFLEDQLDKINKNNEEIIKTLDKSSSTKLDRILEKIDTNYRSAQLLIAEQEQFLTQEEFANLKGNLRQQFRRIDDKLTKIKGTPLHRYCDCSIAEQDKSWDPNLPILKSSSDRVSTLANKYKIPYPCNLQSNSQLIGKSVVLLSWGMGNGHDAALIAIAKRCATLGMHVYNVGFDVEFKNFDPI